MEVTMTERRKERDRARRKRRKAREADERRREERNRRFDELVEAWRRNHLGEHEEEEEGSAYTRKDVFWHNLTRCTKASESEAEGSLVDVARADTVDAELDRLISKLASQDRRLDPDEQEELWKESVRRYNARRQEENRLVWCDYFGRLAARVRSRAEEYDHRAQALLEDRGEGVR
jgi:hypothetical protein